MSDELTRDEFEEWIEDHKDEVIASLPLRGTRKPLGAWIAAFYNGLKDQALAGEGNKDEDEDAWDDDENGGFSEETS